MPEAAGPMSGAGYTQYRSPELIGELRAQFKTRLNEAKQREPDRWRENPHHFIEREATCLMRAIAATYMLIADQEAFESGLLRLVYLDYKRNIIREARVEGDETTITNIIMHWDQLNLDPEF